MKQSPYMASNEFQELMWCSAMVQMLERCIDTTQDKKWVQKFKTAKTYISGIIDERLKYLNDNEKPKVGRRARNTGIKVYAYDDHKVDKADFHRTYTIDSEDFFDLCDAAFLNCYACPQGECVENCQRRALYHRIGLSVHAGRDNPKPGECEFRHNNEQYAVTPQYMKSEQELIVQLP